MSNSACKVAFLDRDGTINVDLGHVHRVADWELIDQVAEAIILLRDAGARIAVVTNQSGVAAGMYVESDVCILHAHMRRDLARIGAQIDAVAFCPHARNSDCSCRKPRVGMAEQIASQLNQRIDYAQSWTIGDKSSDVGFGTALGTRTALIRSRYWRDDELTIKPMLIVDSLYEAAKRITANEGRGDHRG